MHFFSLLGKPQRPSTQNFNLEQCQTEVRDFYLYTMGKVYLPLWIPGAIEDMESIFVDLELVKKDMFKSAEQSQEIASYEDLVTLKSNQDQRVNRVLVLGDAGSGKSTMTANIAYQWAKNDPRSPLSKFSLVFILVMHEVEDNKSSLVDLIFKSYLKKPMFLKRDSNRTYLTMQKTYYF